MLTINELPPKIAGLDFSPARMLSEAVDKRISLDQLEHDYIRAVVGRTNSITGRRYADDPAIQSWQLANEPRPGVSPEAVARHMPAYLKWIDGTARLFGIRTVNSWAGCISSGTSPNANNQTRKWCV